MLHCAPYWNSTFVASLPSLECSLIIVSWLNISKRFSVITTILLVETTFTMESQRRQWWYGQWGEPVKYVHDSRVEVGHQDFDCLIRLAAAAAVHWCRLTNIPYVVFFLHKKGWKICQKSLEPTLNAPVTCRGGWACRYTNSPCWDCPYSRPPHPWRTDPRWQPAKVRKIHFSAYSFRHLLFKMSMRLLLKIGPLKVLSWVENFLFTW